MKLFFGFIAMLLGINFAQSANAQSATYNITLQNTGTFAIIGDYDPPTSTGGMLMAWFPTGYIGAPTGTSQAQIVVPAGLSGASSTFYSGTVASAPSPYFYHEYECAFTVYAGQINSDGTCTAPSATANATYGLSPSKPNCGSPTVVSNGACNYKINFSFGFN